jgi:hypothetical protein
MRRLFLLTIVAVVTVPGAPALAGPKASAADRAAARQTVERYSAALRREDWRSVCRYIAPGTKKFIIERVREVKEIQVKRCATAARLWINPVMGKMTITGVAKSNDPLNVSVEFADPRATYTTYSIYEYGKRWLLAGVVPGPPTSSDN